MTPRCKITDVQRVLLNLSFNAGPAFKNDTQGEQYQFTVDHCGTLLDVYLYDYPYGGQGVSMRHGDSPGEYQSGPVEMWIRGLSQLHGPERDAVVAILATHHVRLSERESANV